MPISQILPDGRVSIYNSKTGQKAVVTPEELGNYNPALIGDYQEKVQEQQAIKDAAESVAGGNLKLTDLPAEDRASVSKALQQSKSKIPADSKKASEINAVLNLVNNLEKNYQAAGGGEVDVPILSRIVGAKKDAEGALGFNDAANSYNRQKSGFAATLKGLTGDTGVLTDQDFARLSKLLPGLGAKPQEAKTLLNDLRSQIKAKYGGDLTQTTIKPDEKNLVETLFPSTTQLAGEAYSNFTNPTQYTKEEAEAKVNEVKNNMNPLQVIINAANGDPHAQELLGATGEVTTAVGAPGVVKGAVTGGKNLLGKVLGNSGLNEARKAAAKDVVVNTKSVIEAGDDYVKNIDPGAQRVWEILKPSLKETTSADELLQKITYWGDKAYTNSGDKRAITEGLLKSHLYKAGREAIAKDAPEIARLTTEMGKDMSRRKVVGKGAGIVGGALAGGAAYALLGKLLGNPGSSN